MLYCFFLTLPAPIISQLTIKKTFPLCFEQCSGYIQFYPNPGSVLKKIRIQVMDISSRFCAKKIFSKFSIIYMLKFWEPYRDCTVINIFQLVYSWNSCKKGKDFFKEGFGFKLMPRIRIRKQKYSGSNFMGKGFRKRWKLSFLISPRQIPVAGGRDPLSDIQ